MRKCAVLLSRLSEEERHQFQRWLAVELNGRQGMIQDMLAFYLSGHEEEALWDQMCPNQTFDSQELGRKFGQLMIHLEEFLAIQAFRKDRMLRDRMLLKRLSTLRLGKEFLKYTNKVRRRLEKSGRRDKWYFEHLFALEGELLQHHILEMTSKAKQRYIRRKEAFLSWVCLAFMDQRVLELGSRGEKRDTPLENWEERMTDLISSFAHNRDEPVLSLLITYKLFLEGEDMALEQVFKQLRENQHRLSSDMKYNFVAILINCIGRQQFLTKDERYFFLRLEVEQTGIQEGWMIVGDYLPSVVYKNHISLRHTCMYFLRPEERQSWMRETFEILEAFKPLLAPAEREEVYYFNLLQCQFFHGQPSLLLERRRIALFTDPYYESDFRLLQLLARFEQRDHYFIESGIKSTRQYIRTHAKIRDVRKKVTLEELTFIHKLFKASSHKDWLSLKEETRHVLKNARQSWLLAEIDKRL